MRREPSSFAIGSLDKNFRGEVKAKGYEGWIELQSAQLGTNRNITSSTSRYLLEDRAAEHPDLVL